METYTLPNIRCVNCNRPIGHFKFNPQFSKKENFDILELNLCCRAAINFPQVFIVNKPNELKINGNKKNVNKLTPLTIKDERCVMNSKNVGIPISYKIDEKSTKLTDDLYINYATETIFIAQ